MSLTRFTLTLAILIGSKTYATASQDAPRKLNMGIAVSLRPVVTELLSSRVPKGWEARPVYAGSNALLRQLQHGGKLAILVTADAATMNKAIKDGLVAKGTEKAIAHNEIWLAALAKDAPPAPKPWASLAVPAAQKIALPAEGVPLGEYASSYLKSEKLWDTWRPHMVYVENAEASVTSLRRQLVQWAFIYSSDGWRYRDELRPVATLPRSPAWIATYYAAPTKYCPDLSICRQLVDSLRDKAAKAIWDKHGFLDADIIRP